MNVKDLPAFPCEWDYINSNRAAANGMTLRDYFAAKALQPVMQMIVDGKHEPSIDQRPISHEDFIAATAYQIADAMLAARASAALGEKE